MIGNHPAKIGTAQLAYSGSVSGSTEEIAKRKGELARLLIEIMNTGRYALVATQSIEASFHYRIYTADSKEFDVLDRCVQEARQFFKDKGFKFRVSLNF